RFEGDGGARLMDHGAPAFGGATERLYEGETVDLPVVGGPETAGEAGHGKPALDHVVVEELAGEAVVTQQVLAFRQLRRLLAVDRHLEPAVPNVCAILAHRREPFLDARVVLAMRLPDRAGAVAAEIADGGEVVRAEAGRDVTEVASRGARADRPRFQDDDPEAPGGQIERRRTTGH